MYLCERVRVCWDVSFMFGSVKSADGPLHSIQGSGFCSTSGPALCTKTAVSLIYYELSLTHIHTPNLEALLLLLYTSYHHCVESGSSVCVCVYEKERMCLLPLEYKWNWENFVLSIFLRCSKCPNISTAEQILSRFSPSSEMFSADSLSLSYFLLLPLLWSKE